jgi:hypothetical protein
MRAVKRETLRLIETTVSDSDLGLLGRVFLLMGR